MRGILGDVSSVTWVQISPPGTLKWVSNRIRGDVKTEDLDQGLNRFPSATERTSAIFLLALSEDLTPSISVTYSKPTHEKEGVLRGTSLD